MSDASRPKAARRNSYVRQLFTDFEKEQLRPSEPAMAMAPVRASRASVRQVFPAADGPTRARVRMAAEPIRVPAVVMTWSVET